MRTRARIILVLLLLACGGLLMQACPTVTLGKVAIKDGSVTATGLTITAEVVVEELEDTEGEEATASDGRGLIGLDLPAGWAVTGARVQSPNESSVRSLIAAPQAAVAFGEAFPLEPGQWWAWATVTQTVPKGRWVHQLEFDVTFPKKSQGGPIGISAGTFSEDLKELASPVWYDAKLKARRIVLTPRAGSPTPAATQPEPPAKGGNTTEDPNAKASGG
jgi:hypothetical protein